MAFVIVSDLLNEPGNYSTRRCQLLHRIIACLHEDRLQKIWILGTSCFTGQEDTAKAGLGDATGRLLSPLGLAKLTRMACTDSF